MKISIIGAGVMGTGIAQLFAGYGYNILLVDKSKKELNKSLEAIKKRLKKLEDDRKLIDKKSILKRINTSTDLNDIKGSAFIIEAVTEDPKVKKQIFKKIDKIIDRKAVIASNTSSVSINELAEMINNKERVIGLHFFNPPTKMQLVELIKCKKTSAATIRRCANLLESIGKIHIEVKDTPGFIVNRLLLPVINDAAKLVDKKISTIEEVDRAMKLGAAIPMGPFQLADLVGIDTVVDILKIMAKETKSKELVPSKLLVKMVKRKELGRKTGKGFYKY